MACFMISLTVLYLLPGQTDEDGSVDRSVNGVICVITETGQYRAHMPAPTLSDQVCLKLYKQTNNKGHVSTNDDNKKHTKNKKRKEGEEET